MAWTALNHWRLGFPEPDGQISAILAVEYDTDTVTDTTAALRFTLTDFSQYKLPVSLLIDSKYYVELKSASRTEQDDFYAESLCTIAGEAWATRSRPIQITKEASATKWTLPSILVCTLGFASQEDATPGSATTLLAWQEEAMAQKVIDFSSATTIEGLYSHIEDVLGTESIVNLDSLLDRLCDVETETIFINNWQGKTFGKYTAEDVIDVFQTVANEMRDFVLLVQDYDIGATPECYRPWRDSFITLAASTATLKTSDYTIALVNNDKDNSDFIVSTSDQLTRPIALGYRTGMSYIQHSTSTIDKHGHTTVYNHCFGWQLVYSTIRGAIDFCNKMSFSLRFVDGGTAAFAEATGVTDSYSWFSETNKFYSSGGSKVIGAVTNCHLANTSDTSKMTIHFPGNFSGGSCVIPICQVDKNIEELCFRLPPITVIAGMPPSSTAAGIIRNIKDPSDGIHDHYIWKRGVNNDTLHNALNYQAAYAYVDQEFYHYAAGLKASLLEPKPLEPTDVIIDNGDNSFTVKFNKDSFYNSGTVTGDCRKLETIPINDALQFKAELEFATPQNPDGSGSFLSIYTEEITLTDEESTYEKTFELKDFDGALPTEDELYNWSTVKSYLSVSISGQVVDRYGGSSNTSQTYPVDLGNGIKIYVRPNSPRFYHGIAGLPRDLYMLAKNKPATRYNNITFMWLANTTKNDTAPIAGYCIELCKVTADGYEIIKDAVGYITDYDGTAGVACITHKDAYTTVSPDRIYTQDSEDGKSGIIIPFSRIRPDYNLGYAYDPYEPDQIESYNFNEMLAICTAQNYSLNGIFIELDKFAKHHSEWLTVGTELRIHVSAYVEDRSGKRYYSFWDKDPYQEGNNSQSVTIQKSDAAVMVYTGNGWIEGEVLVKVDDEWLEAEGVLIKTADGWVEADSI